MTRDEMLKELELIDAGEDVLDAMVQVIDRLETRIHNLEVYLDYVKKVDPALWGAMSDEFVGLPDGDEEKYVREE